MTLDGRKNDVSAVQGHPMSLFFASIERACGTSHLSVMVVWVLSCTVSEILQVYCAPGSWPHSILGGFPLDQLAYMLWVSPSISLTLISREIIFEVFQPMWSLSHQRYRQTDGRHTV